MRVLVAMDSFKGTLDAVAACAAVARGLRRASPDLTIDACPLADGGEGTAAVLHQVLGGEWVWATVTAPLPEPATTVRAGYLWIAGRRPTAVIDLAAASGLPLVPPGRLDPMGATTYGTGELIRHAIERGARRVWLALGGSATVDGGVGAAMALGWRFLDTAGRSIARGGGALEHVASLVPPAGAAWLGATALRAPRQDAPMASRRRVRIDALCDVENPLLGERGAARVFGPQKGATPAEVERLDRGLAHLATTIERELGIDVRALRGGGAAGGAGAGAVAFLDARLRRGGPLVLRLSRFDARVRSADLVVTGEGRLDEQSFEGKVVSAVTRAAAARGVPVAVVAGRIQIDDARARARGLLATEAAAAPGVGDEEAQSRAEPLLEEAAERLGRRLLSRRSIRSAGSNRPV